MKIPAFNLHLSLAQFISYRTYLSCLCNEIYVSLYLPMYLVMSCLQHEFICWCCWRLLEIQRKCFKEILFCFNYMKVCYNWIKRKWMCSSPYLLKEYGLTVSPNRIRNSVSATAINLTFSKIQVEENNFYLIYIVHVYGTMGN